MLAQIYITPFPKLFIKEIRLSCPTESKVKELILFKLMGIASVDVMQVAKSSFDLALLGGHWGCSRAL
jgi:hypothetical protein